MSQSHALSDDQVGQELKKMTAFIKQEAMEKGREIEIKADEEFAIEKSKLVRQETSSIDTTYEKKFKSAQMSQQITRSTMANKTRLKVLSARQELLDSIFEAAEKKLGDATKDKGKYQGILKNLMLEGFYALNEPKLQVRGRKQDYDVLKKAIDGACKEYKEKTKKEISASIDEAHPQPDGCAGGLAIVGGNGKIDINNTFEERLTLLKDTSLPSVRLTLFGKNENRKFYD
ncbi:vacuolar ATP synthase subunit E-like protein [Amylocarpus encephaloides]|uniref:Vacuolar ATP synthase subunit E-like protein n=1 Tax=Amylocarpus encephaloides TaxID=45428 RepID=A0A9P7YP08_9HELO|nr:vacuolar ATP synthase subunit E-like protein [Amylocarpus encephaloides]